MNRRSFLTHSATALGASLLGGTAARTAETAAASSPFAPLVTPPDLSVLLTLQDVEDLARKKLPAITYEYYASGAGDEITLRLNHERYNDLRLHTHVLNDVSQLDPSTTLLGRRQPFPLLLAPAANLRHAHPDGELAVARAANETGVTMVLSSGSNTSVEDVVRAATGPVWFQLYMPKDPVFARGLVKRADAAGAQAICLTVDNPVTGSRNREQRARLTLHPPIPPARAGAPAFNPSCVQCHPPGFDHPHYVGMGDPSSSVTLDTVRPAKLVWDDVAWLKSVTGLPILLKGIMHPDDAERAVGAGVAAIIVSNHGGRELDTQPATIEVLPAITQRVAGRIPVIVDGGVRRGTDIIKALALGASAVQIGRPYIYGLAVGGAAGAAHVIKILRQELLLAMAMLGRPTIAAIDRSVLWSGPVAPVARP